MTRSRPVRRTCSRLGPPYLIHLGRVYPELPLGVPLGTQDGTRRHTDSVESGPRAAEGGLASAVRDLDRPAGPGVAYLAGEARTCQAVRAYLVSERGWLRRSVLAKPFWASGKGIGVSRAAMAS